MALGSPLDRLPAPPKSAAVRRPASPCVSRPANRTLGRPRCEAAWLQVLTQTVTTAPVKAACPRPAAIAPRFAALHRDAGERVDLVRFVSHSELEKVACKPRQRYAVMPPPLCPGLARFLGHAGINRTHRASVAACYGNNSAYNSACHSISSAASARRQLRVRLRARHAVSCSSHAHNRCSAELLLC